jgi:insertion element IS1 protein InsB
VALSQKKSRKLWIWKALDRDTGQLLDWECGHRDQRTFKKLYKRLRQWKVQIYCTDEYQVYRAIIPERRLVMSKRGTTGIERNHTPNRHWFARFKRKSIVVSKSLEMVDLTMALYARFHVNGNDHLLLNALYT